MKLGKGGLDQQDQKTLLVLCVIALVIGVAVYWRVVQYAVEHSPTKTLRSVN
jgi:hypothetical protein